MTKRIGILTMIGENGLVVLPAKEQSEFAKTQRKGLKFDGLMKTENGNLANAIPKPEDFLPFAFRHISATILGAGSWKCTDFTNEKVIKKLAGLLSNKPVYFNHDLDASRVIGANGTLRFTPAKKVQGTVIPAGVDGPIWIDGVLHPEICRQLASYPVPQIQSVSTTVLFEWEPSHEFQDSSGNPDEYEFEYQIGKVVQGKMVRRIVQDVIEGYETSLVWNGADPFAKMLGPDGVPVGIEKSAIVGKELFEADPLKEEYMRTKHFFIMEKSFNDESMLHLHRQEILNYSKTENPIINPNSNTMEITQFLAGVLGVKEEEVTKELLAQYTLTKTGDFTAMKAKADSFTAEQAKVTAAEGKVEKFVKVISLDKVEAVATELESFGKSTTIDAVLEFAKAGKAAMDSKRTAVITAYKNAVGEANEDASVIATIQAADDKLLNGLMKQYGKTLSEKFTGTCNSCKSTDVTFRSTVAEHEENPGAAEVTFDMPGAFRK